MITKEKHDEIWEASGLADYYRRMGELKDIGFKFEDNRCGDMDHWQSEALNEWLGDKTMNDVSPEEINESKVEILLNALILKREYENNL